MPWIIGAAVVGVLYGALIAIRQDDMNRRGVGDHSGSQYVWNRVEGFESLVDRDFQNGGGGINRTVDDSFSPRIPATTI